MSSNISVNAREIQKFRKELKEMCDDISEIDRRILTRAVNTGVEVAKRNTPVVSGFMRKMWRTTPTVQKKGGTEKAIYNAADYASFVNDGHRTVNQKGETTGFVPGQHMLERAEKVVFEKMRSEFDKEVRRINGKHNK